MLVFFFSSRRRHTRCALVTGVQTCALPIFFDVNGKLKETSSGRVALSAPRLFRWEYVKPYEQLVIADGSKVWVYDPDLAQATVRPQGAEEQNSPLATLIDPARLDSDFNVAETGAQGGLDWLELTPKEEDRSEEHTSALQSLMRISYAVF